MRRLIARRHRLRHQKKHCGIQARGNHRSLPPGCYVSELIKEDSGQWRFSRRTVFHDHDYTLNGIGR